jgi:ribonucleoside-diphosphate reductase alpha chain
MYTDYEKAGKGRKTIKAHELWEKILESQRPNTIHVVQRCSKPQIKQKSRYLFVRRICVLRLWSLKDEIAVCNLASFYHCLLKTEHSITICFIP